VEAVANRSAMVAAGHTTLTSIRILLSGVHITMFLPS
jgi:hypothetical protein